MSILVEGVERLSRMDALFLPQHKELLRLVALHVDFRDYGAFVLTHSAIRASLWPEDEVKIRESFRIFVKSKTEEFWWLPNGKRDGLRIVYYDSGNTMQEVMYLNNKLEGEYKRFYNSGHIMVQFL